MGPPARSTSGSCSEHDKSPAASNSARNFISLPHTKRGAVSTPAALPCPSRLDALPHRGRLCGVVTMVVVVGGIRVPLATPDRVRATVDGIRTERPSRRLAGRLAVGL